MSAKRIVLLLLATLILQACEFPHRPPPREVVLSSRYGLVVLDAEILGEGDVPDAPEGWKWVLFRFDPNSFYKPRDVQALGRSLLRQLEARGWSEACWMQNPFTQELVIRVRRRPEGAGIFVKRQREDTYHLEIGPTSPDPPPQCPLR